MEAIFPQREELEAAAHHVLGAHHQDALPENRHEHVYTVRHHPDYDPPTWVELRTMKMHEQGRLRRKAEYRARFLCVSTVTSPLPGYPDHGFAGSCAGCTQKWRVDNGLSSDVSDVEERMKVEGRAP